jgi:hypothetical protein
MKMKNEIRAILIGTFVIALLISSAKNASCEPPAPDKYSKIFELDKNETVYIEYGTYFPNLPEGCTQTVKISINGAPPIEIKGNLLMEGAWEYRATNDNTNIEVSVEATLNGVTYKAYKDLEYDRDGGYSGDDDFAWFCQWMYIRSTEDVLGPLPYWYYFPMSAFITHAPETPKIKIYAYQNDSETITRQNADLNYPELAFLTLVAVKEYPDGRKELYEGDGITISISPANVCLVGSLEVPHELSNLTEAGGQFLVDYLARIQNNQDFEWKGFYEAVGYGGIDRLKGAVQGTDASNGNPASNNDLSVLIGKDKNPVVIGIRSWNYVQFIKTVDFVLSVTGQPTGEIVELDKSFINIGLNIDNVDFVREEIAYEQDYKNKSIEENRPGTGEHWTKDPGAFVVRFKDKNTVNETTRKGRRYEEIIEIMVDVQKNPSLKLEPGGGVDWLQVAAVDIYNTGGKVFNCVWEVVCKDLGNNRPGMVEEPIGWPWRISLNPFFFEEIRFNLPQGSSFGFVAEKARDSAIRHEALHCYLDLPGMYVDDEERLGVGDLCYIEHGGGENPHLRYSFDSKDKGYLLPNEEKADPVDKWLNGLTGDSVMHEPLIGHYMTRIDNRLKPWELEAVFSGQGGPNRIPTDIPDNLPFLYEVWVRDVYLKGPKETIRLAARSWINITEQKEPNIYYTKGYQLNTKYYFEIKAYPNNTTWLEPGEILQFILGGYELYVLYMIYYMDMPYEYDASYFGVSY